MSYYWGFRPYVSVAAGPMPPVKWPSWRRRGGVITPVKLESKKIATTFWGKAWCENLESYSDYENRLPRGRTYVRNGSVVDLQIEPGRITAVVSGSELYDVQITIKPLLAKIWSCLKGECGGKIGSRVELLQGRLSQGVMELVTQRDSGLFPAPGEIDLDCSCPDSAGMCKHIAAVMYGVGARLDQQPELLFKLRKVDHLELIAEAGAPTIGTAAATTQTIAAGDLADVFGIELEAPAVAAPVITPPARKSVKRGSLAARRLLQECHRKPSQIAEAPGQRHRGRGRTEEADAKEAKADPDHLRA